MTLTLDDDLNFRGRGAGFFILATFMKGLCMSHKLFLIIMVIICIIRCDLFTHSNNRTFFFPLQVGKKWHYKIVKSDFDINKENFFFPKEFTVEVTQMKTINDIDYYAIKNYFLPGPSLPEPTYMRIEGDRIFVLINDQEHLLYSFDSADSSSWHLPMYANPTYLYDSYTSRVKLNSAEAEFLWWLGTTFGRSEAHWTDVFQKGIGRTKMLSFSQAYGDVNWELIR